MQIQKEQKRKLISAGITVVVHIIIILLLFAFGLPYQDPPPPEQGVEISAGDLTDVGNSMIGDVGGENSEENTVEPSNTDEESFVTQTTEKSPISSKKNPPKRENAKKDNKPAVENDALFPGKKQSSGSGTGTGSGSGEGTNGTGGGGNGTNATGGGYSLNGRSAKLLPKPKTNKNDVGNVVVDIKVDQDGNVKEARAGAKGTTLMDTNIWRICEQAAKKAKFSAKEDAPELQKGTITYHFVH